MSLELANAALMLAALGLYVILGGADFGAGVWDLFATGPRAKQQRTLLANAIAPIWEANHVWLIAVVVILFTAFPRAFAGIMTAMHVPVTLALIGIVARGTSFVFRSYSPDDDTTQRRWSLVFSIASIITPVLLGMTLATLASGTLEWRDGVYSSGFFAPWIRPFPIATGVLTLALFSHLAAVYTCLEATDRDLREDFRRRALFNAVFVILAAAAAWIFARIGAPVLSRDLAQSAWTWPVVAGAGLAAIAGIWSLRVRAYATARALAVIQSLLIIVGFGAALFPYLVVPHYTIQNSAAPAATLRLVLIAFAAGAVILIPSLLFLMRTFKGRRAFQILGGVEGEGTGR